MKKPLLLLTTLMLALTGFAQRGIMQIHTSSGTVEERYVDEIEKITFRTEDDQPFVNEAVDLGLSVKWASANVGADAPEDFGGYYAWGETQEKEVYNNTTYKYYNLEWGTITRIGTEITGTQYDVAKKTMGGDWRMPTHDEWIELLTRCEWTWATVNGVNGYRVTGSTGNSIFIPAAGRLYSVEGSDINGYENRDGFYWTSTLYPDDYDNYVAYRTSFGATFAGCEFYDVPEIGMSVRAVQGVLADVDPEPEPGPMDMVDLGLSVKWASHNVMASKPSDVGYFYAWGMTKKSPSYGDPAYPYHDAETGKYADLGREISGTNYDIASVRWGNGWRLPTKAEIDEMVQNCTFTYGALDGQSGVTVKGPNGNSIFLPMDGYFGVEGQVCDDPYDIMGLPFQGFYMTGTSKPSRSGEPGDEASAYALKLSKSQGKDATMKSDDTFKCLGINVRPVHE